MKRITYYGILFLWVLTSCIHDDKLGNQTIPGEEGEIEIVFSVNLPTQLSSPTTYAMNDVSENELETVDILAFKSDGNGNETFLYKVVGRNITTSSEDVSKKKFQATLIKKGFAQRFVIIGNAHNELEGLGTIEQTGVKEEVLKRLIFDNQEEGWNSESDTDFTPFPMWGETGTMVLNDATTQITDIKLLRMAARIDVLLDPEVKGNFKLESVALYNRKTRGHVVPNTASTHWDSNNRKAIKATIPEDNISSPLTILGPLRYTEPTTQDSSFIQTIYTFESSAVGLDESSKATCIVVGGRYEDDSDPTYYRLDFVEKDDNGHVTNYKDVLRNHLYRINIVEVSGRGYPTEDDAFNAQAINMEVIIREWDQGDYGNIVFDGQYLLAVDPGEYNLPRDEQKNLPIKIFTDYPKGWTATKESGADWLTITSPNPIQGAADTDCILLFDIEENDTGSSRSAKIKITAGRLTYEVIVTQSIEDSFTLRVTDIDDTEIAELIFPSLCDLTYCDISQQLKVNWTPVSIPCVISDHDMTTNAFSFTTITNPVGRSLAGGNELLVIEATEMSTSEISSNPFMEKIKRLDFTVNKGSSYKMQSVFLRQVNYTVIPEGVLESYTMDGNTYTFKVRSNAAWEATVSKDQNKIMVANSYTTSGGPSPDEGETFTFKLINDENLGSAVAEITFTSPEGKFHPVTVIINAKSVVTARVVEAANCYMLTSGGDAVSFPVSQANADGITRLTSSTEFTLELLWTDSDHGLSSQGVVESYSFTGKGSDARIIVKSGQSEGNAVIALKVGQTIKWSWHIWVVNYDPEGSTLQYKNHTFMDRNLGALSASSTSDQHFGLFYQFGRKDPFPGVSGINKTTLITTYNEDGVQKEFTTRGVAASDNIENGIENPFVFYLGTTANSGDWSTTGTTGTTKKLWGSNGSKSAYDPCPYGWRVSRSPDAVADNPFNLEYPAYEGNSWVTTGGYSSYIGFYPAGGYLKNSATGYTLTETSKGYVWSIHELGSNQGRAVQIENASWIGNMITPSNYRNRGDGIYVRCVKNYTIN